MKRRRFLNNVAASISALPVLQILPFVNHESNDNLKKKLKEQGKILPPVLNANSKIAITAPASPTSMYEVRHSLRFFKSLGMDVEIGNTIKEQRNRYRYLSAPDEIRAEEFMEFVKRDDIDAISFARGGYGVMRILHLLDFDKIRSNPKIYVGYSDMTALLYAIYKITGIVTFHGPVASSKYDYFTKQHFKKILTNYEVKLSNNHSGMIVVNKGEAKGELAGGNLTMISSTLGTDYEIDTEGKILFIEDVSEDAYKIDRMLTQLRLSGKLHQAAAIVFGDFKNLNVRRPFFPNRGYTIREVVDQIVKPVGVPTVIGLPFGHTKSKMTLPLGITGSLDTNSNKFEIIEKAVF